MKQLIFLLFYFILFACTQKEKPTLVISGMSLTEVLQIEGEPLAKAAYSHYALLFYCNQTLSERPEQKTHRVFIFQDNKLIEYSTFNAQPSCDIGLTAEQRLVRWIDQQNRPVNPSATISSKLTIPSH
ncbi:hypothetical protein MASR2M36_22530 [Providencia sp.]